MAENRVEIVIHSTGDTRCIYTEALDLAALGEVKIVRASHVEPDAGGSWWADLSPVGGPRLGPFDRRTEALTAETGWLADHWLLPDQCALPGPGALPAEK